MVTKNLGYHYDKNKLCYYTNDHKREDVILDREERFLGDYFKLEQRKVLQSFASERWHEDIMKTQFYKLVIKNKTDNYSS